MFHLRIDRLDERFFCPAPNWLWWRALGMAMAALSATAVVGAIVLVVWAVVAG